MEGSSVRGLILFMRQHGLTLSFAESVTAGMAHHAFSQFYDTGPILQGSVVTYQRELKERLLGVRPQTLDRYTAESQEVTTEMAIGLRRLLGSQVCAAITGLAHPGGSENSLKPVGTIFTTVLYKELLLESRFCFEGSREEIVQQAIRALFTNISQLIMHAPSRATKTLLSLSA